MILIGSRALEYYIPLNRKLHDWDFIATEPDLEKFNKTFGKYLVKQTETSVIYDINGDIVEITKALTSTDHHLFYYIEDIKLTPFGYARIPSFQKLYDIKKATAMCIDEPKHKYDLVLMELQDKHKFQRDSDFFKARLAEIQARQAKSNKVMFDFFHKYKDLPEYVRHDRLHTMIADLLDLNIPTYQRITVAETDISEALFNKLSHEQKISLMVEEVLVLNLERYLIPQIVEHGANYRVIDKFYRNNEAESVYKILKYVCLKGLKTEKDYIVNFGKANFFEIEREWIAAKEKIKAKGGLPDSFFMELFELRKKYKNNEVVGLHNDPRKL